MSSPFSFNTSMFGRKEKEKGRQCSTLTNESRVQRFFPPFIIIIIINSSSSDARERERERKKWVKTVYHHTIISFPCRSSSNVERKREENFIFTSKSSGPSASWGTSAGRDDDTSACWMTDVGSNRCCCCCCRWRLLFVVVVGDEEWKWISSIEFFSSTSLQTFYENEEKNVDLSVDPARFAPEVKGRIGARCERIYWCMQNEEDGDGVAESQRRKTRRIRNLRFCHAVASVRDQWKRTRRETVSLLNK